ncbi:MAG TPA: ADP-ribosylation factor-directed GTPase activating protein isoform b [Pirellulaceae bacterium]|nr:ADP-ribosylation factor-directed GTPase activating protein isoform b [Pirellulaceae bacterium]
MTRTVYLVATLSAGVLLAGCNQAGDANSAATTAAMPVSSGNAAADPADLPSDAELLKQIDEALEYTFDHRRLSVGQGANDQAAWQIIHGALAFKREFLVRDGDKDVSAVDYILGGGSMKGLSLRRGDPLDDEMKPSIPGGGLRYGITTVVANDKMGQGHTDQWLGYLSDCKLPLEQPLVVEGRPHTIADYIDQAKRDVHKNPIREYSWTLMALNSYYPTDYTWQAADGSEWSIAKLVEIELEHSLDQSPCGGTHRMTALTMAYNRRQVEGKPFEGVWKSLAERIEQCVNKAREFQNPDGSLSSNYFARPGKSADLAICMGSAGHVMEFIATALDKDQLQEPWVKRAVLDVCKLFRKTKPVDVECGALFHAAHGLVLYREKVFGPRTFGKEAAAAVTAAKPE